LNVSQQVAEIRSFDGVSHFLSHHRGTMWITINGSVYVDKGTLPLKADDRIKEDTYNTT
jgi:hypothetical protein